MTELTSERWATDGGHRAIDQYAFSLFIGSGALDRHLRRSRLAYRKRQLKLVDRLTSEIPGAKVEGIAGLGCISSFVFPTARVRPMSSHV